MSAKEPTSINAPTFSLPFFDGYGEKIPLEQFAALFLRTGWTWTKNNRCKHLVIFMDTRERMVRVYDRDQKAITMAELSRQMDCVFTPTPVNLTSDAQEQIEVASTNPPRSCPSMDAQRSAHPEQRRGSTASNAQGRGK